VDEAGFLVESKTAALIAELPANEAKLVAADSIVRALGVTDGPGFDALMEALTANGNGSLSNAGGERVRIWVGCLKGGRVSVSWCLYHITKYRCQWDSAAAGDVFRSRTTASGLL
jgi:hypothetical protein